jgi:lysine 2,3-aminomutase
MHKAEAPAETLIIEDDEPPSGRLALDTLYPAPPAGQPSIQLTRPVFILPAQKTTFPRHPKLRPETKAFQKQFFPGSTARDWHDWQWQVRHRIHTYERLHQILPLGPDELLADHTVQLPLSITPYYASLIPKDVPDHPLRRCVVPTAGEWVKLPCESDDPLGEDHQSPVPGLVHRYPDRVLFLLTDFCSTYCRYCTRSRVVGHGGIRASRARWEKAIAYIAANPSVRDVLLSGGDPLTLSDDRLEWVLSKLRQIPHVEIIRIGTKVPAVLPQRITPKLVKMLKKYHPLWLSLHFTHPDECTPETASACALLADAGIPLGSQTVLLKKINDTVPVMTQLMHELMKMRVRPYYLYQCDPITGSGHFRTAIAKGLEIIKGMRGFTTGYAVPTYVVDAPGGGGKIPLMPEYVSGRAGDDLVLTNYENRPFTYPDPDLETHPAVSATEAGSMAASWENRQ